MLKILFNSIREYKKQTLLAPLFTIFAVFLEIIIPKYLATLIDDGIYQKDMSRIWQIGTFLTFLCFISVVVSILSSKYAASASTGFCKNLRSDMYKKIQSFSFENLDKFSTSSLITRLTTDITNIQNAYQLILRIVVKAPIMIILALIMSYFINPKTSIIFLVASIILLIGLYFIIKSVFPIFQKIYKTYDKLNGVVQENLHGIRVVKSYTRENLEEEKFKKVSLTIFQRFIKTDKLVAITTPLMMFVMNGCLLFLAFFCTKFIIDKELLVGEFMTLVMYTGQVLMSLMMLSIVLVMVIISKASAERVLEVLTEDVDLVNKKDPIKTIKNGDIVFKNVSFSYTKNKEKCCLKNINLTIKKGESVGILGATGSSKTTLVQLIPRLYDTLDGDVLIDGINVKDYEIETLRKSISMVLQKNVLFSGTIKENLKMANKNATDEDMIKACKIACASSFIESFEKKYDTHIEQGGTNVSGGQRQRLCIARAILEKPNILILDDSTSAVDTKTDKSIRDALKTEIPDTTQIIIAQRISSIQHLDKIIVLENGEITNVGNHSYLLKNSDIYREMHDLQNNKGGIKDDE